MRRTYAPRIPRGTHTQSFAWLDPEEQRQTGRRLLDSGVTETAVADLTGLSIEQVRRIAAITAQQLGTIP